MLPIKYQLPTYDNDVGQGSVTYKRHWVFSVNFAISKLNYYCTGYTLVYRQNCVGEQTTIIYSTL